MNDHLTSEVTEYTFNALPQEARVADWHVWNVYARKNRAGRWVVTDGHTYYDTDGRPYGTAREAGEHGHNVAINLAGHVALRMRINGETVGEAAARIMRVQP